MSVELITLLEFAAAGIILYAVLNEKKLIKFEDKIAALFKRKKTKKVRTNSFKKAKAKNKLRLG